MSDYRRLTALALSASLLFSLTACSKNVLPGNSKVEISEEEVIDAASSFSRALKEVDYNTISNLSSEISSDNEEFISNFDFVELFGEDSYPVYEAYYNMVSFEVLDDSVSIDGNKATINVEFTYPDYLELEPESFDCDGWVDAIDNATEFETISIKYDVVLEDEKVSISNGNKIINKFYHDEVVNVYFYVDTYVFYADAVSATWSKDVFEATDVISIDIICSSDAGPDGKDLNVSLRDSSMNSIVSATYTYLHDDVFSLEVDAEYFDKDYLDSGFYSVVVEAPDGSIFYSSSVYVNAYVEPEIEETVFESDYLDGIIDSAPEVEETIEETEVVESEESEEIDVTTDIEEISGEDVVGIYDEETYEFVNEFFGFRFIAPEETLNLSDALMEVYGDKPVLSGFAFKEMLENDDLEMTAAFFVADIGMDINTEEELISFLGSENELVSNIEPIEINGISFFCIYKEETNETILLRSRENKLLIVTFVGYDKDDLTNMLLDRVQPI